MLWLFNFHEDHIFMDIVGLLSVIIYEVLYTRYLRYNICSAWILDIRISTTIRCQKFFIEYPKGQKYFITNNSHTKIFNGEFSPNYGTFSVYV